MAPTPSENKPTDLGSKAVATVALGLYARATTLRGQATSTGGAAAGKHPDDASTGMIAEAQAAEKDAEQLRVTAEALTIREEAAKAWNRDAPKDSELDAAREAVTAAKKKLSDAATASGDTSAARTELEAASNHLGILLRKRRDADAAYDAAGKKAQEKLGTLGTGTGDGAETDDHGRGTPAPGTGTPAPGAGTPAPSTGIGRPSGETGKRTDPGKSTPGAGTPGTPSPSATKPTETSSGDDLSGLLTQLAAQQQQQSAAQAQPAAVTPAATPTAAVPQQQEKKDTPQSKSNPLESLLGSDGVFGLDDAARALGTPAVALGGGSAPTTSTPSTPAAVTPSAPAASAQSATGLSASATANQQPTTSGTSAQSLNTSTDVSGRPAEQQRTAFSVGPETKTSGATSTGTSGTTPASATGTRPMGGGMPIMSPVGGMGGPAGGGAGKEKEQTQLAAGSEEAYILHGRAAVDAAVPGGTIAQRDHPRRRPDEDAA